MSGCGYEETLGAPLREVCFLLVSRPSRRRIQDPGFRCLVSATKRTPGASPAVETHRLQEGQDRRGPEAGGHPASHVARWNRLHLVEQGGGGLEQTISKHSARAEPVSPPGRWRRRDRPRLCDASNEASAFSTLIRQRPPTPSCRGLSPYCGENSEPGRYVTESLTTNPRVREQPRL